MKRKLLLIMAALTVLGANAWVLLSAKRNQRDPAGGTLELTERELRLPPMLGDSTALFLELNWEMVSSAANGERAPEWLDATKLAELGFDCTVPVSSPGAKAHYSSLVPVPVYIVLDYSGEAWKKRDGNLPDRANQLHRSRLFAVDAGLDATRLRLKYPDPARQAIVRGVVRAFLHDRDSRDGTTLPKPRLGGWVQSIIPDQIYVPPPHNQILQSLRVRDRANDRRAGLDSEPRYAVTIAWGARYEPWVKAARLLPEAAQKPATSP